MTIWNDAKTRYRHLVGLRAMIMNLNKRLDRQAQTIVDYQHSTAGFQCKIHDLKTIIYLQEIAKQCTYLK